MADQQPSDLPGIPDDERTTSAELRESVSSWAWPPKGSAPI
ncbi:hypothetical protein [Streptomyces sp. NPDC058867]